MDYRMNVLCHTYIFAFPITSRSTFATRSGGGVQDESWVNSVPLLFQVSEIYQVAKVLKIETV